MWHSGLKEETQGALRRKHSGLKKEMQRNRRIRHCVEHSGQKVKIQKTENEELWAKRYISG